MKRIFFYIHLLLLTTLCLLPAPPAASAADEAFSERISGNGRKSLASVTVFNGDKTRIVIDATKPVKIQKKWCCPA
ncbi:hypothetical protein [Selenomonas ruminantium]|uniref:hypothetical protein n=1 Tax=Selenomonas ruminantium TaxID=971 RepID=UPI00047C556B|nr:hypothetical protein [Selenomonas ruminantium]